MKSIINLIVIILLIFSVQVINTQTLLSPNGKLRLNFSVNNTGEPVYELSRNDQKLIFPSKLGLILSEGNSLIDGFSISKTENSSFDETWEPVWGEVKSIRNNYNELKITLTQEKSSKRFIIITFRLFDDGLGFRYEFPAQQSLTYFTVIDELTQFNLGVDYTAFWIPGDYDSNEYYYTEKPLLKFQYEM